ncbi:molybdopterin oxidoreductase [Rhodoferax koreense]|uniref:Molybdopterin oxidoreductase n=1 Tax=Rhodoferax koreensis TaxID=1842727 RepID=A0A1P8JR99_9BURK|nr:molybdopterin-dependent oxidoreductase [Rhodoferax koreense]APW36283.1 molybdopterin oxidoreductase [Rhodoferax koreense]
MSTQTKTGHETTVLAACPHDCPDTCSMLVKVQDGKVKAVQGNPSHPFTQGRLCAKTNHYQERVYHPERLLYPMRRTGAKGSGQFERITWEDALNEIAQRWRTTIAESGPRAILPYSYLGTQGLVNGLTVGDPFFNKLGATVSERTFCDSGASTAYIMTVGPTPGMDPESFQHSKLIILWACNMLSTNAHMWPFVEKAQRNGAKLIVIDPVRTRGAQQADQHIRIKPGTDTALALAMMNVIVNEDLIDHDYVAQYTTGFDELKAHVQPYTPEFAAEVSGVDAEVIRTLAREYAATQPAAIRIGVGIERSAGGGQLVRAVTSLPALVGAWRKPGGGILQLPLWAFPINWDGLHRADFIPEGTPVINQWHLGRALTHDLGLETPIQSLFIYNSNPLVVAPDQVRLIEGLSREDLFTVVSEHFMTDTARYADILLPATTQVEQVDLMFSWGHFYLTLNQQSVPPIGEAVSNSELFRRLARAMDFEDPFFYRDDEELMQASMLWDHPAMQGITMEGLRATGYARLNMPSADTYAPHAQGGFPTPSGKVELKASMAAGGNFVLPVFRQGYNGFQDGGPVDALPTFHVRHESAAKDPALAGRFPLSMMSPKSHAFINSNYGNMRRQLAHQGEQYVLINPADASARGIPQGAVVTVQNGRGTFKALARVTDEAMAGVVVTPLGYWIDSSIAGATPAALNPTAFADLGRAPTFSDNLVEVTLD